MKIEKRQDKKPYFARFLETQELTDIRAGATTKYPSDADEDVTHKWPSDDDEGGPTY